MKLDTHPTATKDTMKKMENVSLKEIKMKDKPDFIMELQKLASENEDVSVTIDENGEVEFVMDEALFIEFVQLQWLQAIERNYN
tara:strand:- start:37 stop:288 length:252 start_codon:yes stop_codon:yes gene_type:complete